MSIPRAKEILMKIVKAGAVQLSPVLYSCEGTVEKVAWKIQELGKRVQFATFPETVVPYYARISRVFAGEAEVLTRDDVLDNITLYWLTNTAISSARLYWENKLAYFSPKGVS